VIVIVILRQRYNQQNSSDVSSMSVGSDADTNCISTEHVAVMLTVIVVLNNKKEFMT